jgi:hypothetical protein
MDLAPRVGTAGEARALSRRLGGLPLALHHAGSYLSSPFTAERSFSAYRKALDDRLPVMLGTGADSRSVVTSTWEISLDSLTASGNSQARPLLRVFFCFAPSVEIGPILLDYTILGRECGGQGDTAVRSGLQALLSARLSETRTESAASIQASSCIRWSPPQAACASRQRPPGRQSPHSGRTRIAVLCGHCGSRLVVTA